MRSRSFTMTGKLRTGLVVAFATLSILLLPAAISLASGPGEPILPQEQEVVDLVNQERAARNKPPMLVNYQLQVAAWLHNEHMVKTGKFAHSGIGDGEPSDRVKQSGYSGGGIRENIAWGYRTPAAVMEGWMNSSGHKANILSDSRDIGVAYNPSGPHWTQVFANPNPNVPTVTPPTAPVAEPCDLPDFDEDRAVTQVDVDLVGEQFMMSSEDPNWDASFDLIADGIINVYDLYEVMMVVGETCD